MGAFQQKLDTIVKRCDDYNPNQPRKPAGSTEGGQWAANGGGDGGAPRLRRKFTTVAKLDGNEASRAVSVLIKVPPPPVTRAAYEAVNTYVQASGSLNNSLRREPHSASIHSSFTQLVNRLDDTLAATPGCPVSLVLYRYLPSSVIGKMEVGQTYTDFGYMSTSFSRHVGSAHVYGMSSLEIEVPKGFKFLSVPSFWRGVAKANVGPMSSYAMEEAEALLPRGTGLEIVSIGETNGLTKIRARAVFSSIQPPGTQLAKHKLREGSVAKQAYDFWKEELAGYKKLSDVPKGELAKIGQKISTKFGIKSGVNYSYFFAKNLGLEGAA